MSEEEVQRLVTLLKALADESRLRMVGILAAGERSGVELADLLGLRAATVSHHLAKLREVGLVTARTEGTSKRYALDRAALGALQDELLSPGAVRAIVPEAAPDAFASRVMAAFFDGEKLLRIPANRRKREVVLDFLASRFEIDASVPESEVNERIARHHWDTATLRRELIGGGWMTRADGIYRRVR